MFGNWCFQRKCVVLCFLRMKLCLKILRSSKGKISQTNWKHPFSECDSRDMGWHEGCEEIGSHVSCLQEVDTSGFRFNSDSDSIQIQIQPSVTFTCILLNISLWVFMHCILPFPYSTLEVCIIILIIEETKAHGG